MSLDADEQEYLDRQIEEYKKEKFNEIKEDIINIFRQCVEKDVYSYDSDWDRLYRLLDHINAEEIEKGGLFVFEDLSNAGYYSAVDKYNVDDRLDSFIFEGHVNQNRKVNNMFTNYPYAENPGFQSGQVLQDAKKMIETKYPELEVTIVTSKSEE